MRQRRPVVIAIGCGLGLLLSILSFCIAGGIVWMQQNGQIGTPIPQSGPHGP